MKSPSKAYSGPRPLCSSAIPLPKHEYPLSPRNFRTENPNRSWKNGAVWEVPIKLIVAKQIYISNHTAPFFQVRLWHLFVYTGYCSVLGSSTRESYVLLATELNAAPTLISKPPDQKHTIAAVGKLKLFEKS